MNGCSVERPFFIGEDMSDQQVKYYTDEGEKLVDLPADPEAAPAPEPEKDSSGSHFLILMGMFFATVIAVTWILTHH